MSDPSASNILIIAASQNLFDAYQTSEHQKNTSRYVTRMKETFSSGNTEQQFIAARESLRNYKYARQSYRSSIFYSQVIPLSCALLAAGSLSVGFVPGIILAAIGGIASSKLMSSKVETSSAEIKANKDVINTLKKEHPSLYKRVLKISRRDDWATRSEFNSVMKAHVNSNEPSRITKAKRWVCLSYHYQKRMAREFALKSGLSAIASAGLLATGTCLGMSSSMLGIGTGLLGIFAGVTSGKFGVDAVCSGIESFASKSLAKKLKLDISKLPVRHQKTKKSTHSLSL